jgi:glycosyltransferase involved in cell wall biosynthesis
MRVGFDTTPLERSHPPGITRAVEETLAALEKRKKLEVVRLAPPSQGPLASWRQRVLPKTVRELALAGIHSFVSAFCLFGSGARVQTIHELPWKHGVRENADLAHRLWAGLFSRRADAVVTASERVARELPGKLASEGGRIHVIPWGVGAQFREEPPPGAVDELVLARYPFPGGAFALCPGAVRAKKNLAALLAGHAAFKKRGGASVQLVVTGPETSDLRRDLALAQRLGIARFVSTPGTIAEADLPALLRLAAFVPVLSRSEGFSLPVLEALACGTPVVVPRSSVQEEIAGEHAIAVDAADPESVASGIAEALERREELRAVLPARAREFTWERTAAGIERLWETLA